MKLRATLMSFGLLVVTGVSAERAMALRPLPTYTAVRLNSPEPQTGARFGDHMAVVGDLNGDAVNDIAVSSESQNSGAVAGIGVVWIFSGKTHQLISTIQNPDPQPGNRFGDSIVGVGDVNGDRVSDLMIAGAGLDVYVGHDNTGNPNTQPCGAPEPNGCNEGQGQVYIFSGRTGNLIRRIGDPAPQAGALFGYGFALAPGDLNGNGSPDFVVTAEGENVGLCDVNMDGSPPAPCPVGAAYAFDGKTGALIHRFDDPNPETYAGFGGGGTSSPGDVTGDGVGDIVIGANGSSGGGHAYLFNGKSGALVRSIPNPAPAGSDLGGGVGFGFGQGSGIEPGDINGDRVRDLLVSAPGQDVGGVGNAGRLYVLSGKDGSVIRTLDDPHPKPSGSFGFNQASAGDINGDGTPDIIASRFVFPPSAYPPLKPPGAAAYIFDGRTGKALVTLPGMMQDGPGNSLVSPGDLNGDGYPDFFLGGRVLVGGAGANSGQVIVELSKPPPPPRVTGYGLTSNSFVVGAASTPLFAHAARKIGTKFRYKLSQAARVKIAIIQRGTGRSKGTLTRISHKGANSVTFSGRIGSRALSPGKYRATLTAVGAAGNTSKPKTISFRIVTR